jgi:hypothetical protein
MIDGTREFYDPQGNIRLITEDSFEFKLPDYVLNAASSVGHAFALKRSSLKLRSGVKCQTTLRGYFDDAIQRLRVYH